VIIEPKDEQVAAPAQLHLTPAVHDLDRLSQQLAAELADPELERWPGAPALSTPHSRRSAKSDPSRDAPFLRASPTIC
jgi:hypothetical protein